MIGTDFEFKGHKGTFNPCRMQFPAILYNRRRIRDSSLVICGGCRSHNCVSHTTALSASQNEQKADSRFQSYGFGKFGAPVEELKRLSQEEEEDGAEGEGVEASQGPAAKVVSEKIEDSLRH